MIKKKKEKAVCKTSTNQKCMCLMYKLVLLSPGA